MKSIKTLALVTGLLALSGVSQAQFSSTWTLVSDYDFRGFSQTSKNPALQGSADYAFGDSGFSIGAWASNVDFDSNEDMELDGYMNYVGKINDTFAWTTGFTWYDYPLGTDSDGFAEAYVGFNAGSFGFKQWYSPDWLTYGDDGYYTEANYTQPIGDKFSIAVHGGYSWGPAWDGVELFDYSVAANFTAGKFTIFGKFTGTDGSESDGTKITTDLNNNEPRFLIGVMTTFPWGD